MIAMIIVVYIFEKKSIGFIEQKEISRMVGLNNDISSKKKFTHKL